MAKKSHPIRKIIIIFIIILVLGALYIYFLSKRKLPEQKFKIDNAEIVVEVADNSFSRIRGLSYRQSLSADHGMLFIFDNESQPSFWMKGMKFPIDIIWIKDDKIIGINSNVAADGGSSKYAPPVNVKKVLEVPAGTAERYNWKVGSNASVAQR